MSNRSAPLREAVLRHAALAVVVVLVAVVSISGGIALFARDEAYRDAENVARQVGAAVGEPVSHRVLSAPVDAGTRATLHGALTPFLAGGVAARVKIWAASGDVARIVFSDEPRVEGAATRLDAPGLAEPRIGRPLVQPVPADAEHRFEAEGASRLLEVFTAFRDASGGEAWLELYIPVDESGTARAGVLPVVGVAVGALCLLALGLLPFSLAHARRVEHERVERRAARDYGLTAAERARREIARRLHDGVIPDLATVGLLLELARGERTDSADGHGDDIVGRAHDLLTRDMDQLRELLTDITGPDVVADGLLPALRELARGLSADGSVSIHVEDAAAAPVAGELATVLFRVGYELVRNAVRHGRPRHVRVRVDADPHAVSLCVLDDGVGFDVGAPAARGHVGLLLARGVLAEHGGALDVASTPGSGTSATASVPTAVRRPRLRRRRSATA